MFYDFICDNKACSQHTFTVYQKIDEEHKAVCPKCGKPARRIFTPKPFRIDFVEGYDPGLGEYVTSARERANIVAKNNLRRVKD